MKNYCNCKIKKAEQVLLDVRNNLDLISDDLREWNRNYFVHHEKKYAGDLGLIEKYYKQGNILEIGSMPFHFTALLKSLGYQVIGLDLNPRRADNFIKKYDLNIVKCDIEKDKLPFNDNSFQLIILSEVFEHLRIDPIATLKEINRVLADGGYLIVTVPNLYSVKKIISFNLGRGINNAYKEFEKLRTIGHMGHVREYSMKEMKDFLRNTGYEIVETRRKYYKLLKGILGPLNIFYWLSPAWRPYLVLVCRKDNKQQRI